MENLLVNIRASGKGRYSYHFMCEENLNPFGFGHAGSNVLEIITTIQDLCKTYEAQGAKLYSLGSLFESNNFRNVSEKTLDKIIKILNKEEEEERFSHI